jgi:hypothetical protein
VSDPVVAEKAAEDKSELQTFMSGLDAAIEKQESERKPPDDSAPAKKSDEEKPESEPEKGEVEGDAEPPSKDGEQAPALDDAMLERAVKVGLSLADAKAVGDPAVLERLIGRLEKTSEPEKKDEEKKEPEEDLVAKIPDLSPDEYDKGLVDAFKALKGVAQKLQESNKQLRQEVSRGVASRGTWVDNEVAKLGKDYAELFGEGNLAELPAGKQKAAREKLERSISFVQSEAKAEGKSVSRGDAFKQALALGFSDKVQSTKGAAAKEAAAKRSQQAMNRPRASSGQFARDTDNVPGSPAERVAEAVDAVKALMEET